MNLILRIEMFEARLNGYRDADLNWKTMNAYQFYNTSWRVVILPKETMLRRVDDCWQLEDRLWHCKMGEPLKQNVRTAYNVLI